MFRRFCLFLHRFNGWKIVGDMPADIKQCVMIGAPHTSNWDFIYALATYEATGVKVRFTIKKEWVRFPFKTLFIKLGAIPIDRTPKHAGSTRNSMVDVMAKLFEQHPELVVLVTPEGTRKPVKRWKNGFYHVAVQANVPIALGYADYAKKESGIGGVVWPSGDMQADMRKIYDFYNSVAPCHPDNYIKL